MTCGNAGSRAALLFLDHGLMKLLQWSLPATRSAAAMGAGSVMVGQGIHIDRLREALEEMRPDRLGRPCRKQFGKAPRHQQGLAGSAANTLQAAHQIDVRTDQ